MDQRQFMPLHGLSKYRRGDPGSGENHERKKLSNALTVCNIRHGTKLMIQEQGRHIHRKPETPDPKLETDFYAVHRLKS